MKWYARLPSESIIDLKTLSDEFIKASSAYKEVKHGMNTLFLIRQRDKGKPQRLQKKRFITEYAKVDIHDNRMVDTTFKKRLSIEFELNASSTSLNTSTLRSMSGST